MEAFLEVLEIDEDAIRDFSVSTLSSSGKRKPHARVSQGGRWGPRQVQRSRVFVEKYARIRLDEAREERGCRL
jgi:hypothetical protein